MWGTGVKKCRSFRMYLNLKDYLFETSRQLQVNIYEPHGNHKSKTYNRYTKKERKEHQHTTKENHRNTKEETKRRKREEIQIQPENK